MPCRLIRLAGLAVLIGAAAGLPRSATAADAPAELLFETQVAPILVEHCQKCHAQKDPKGQLDLSSLAGILRGGETGPAVVRGKPDESLLLDKITSGDMPPRKRKSSPPTRSG